MSLRIGTLADNPILKKKKKEKTPWGIGKKEKKKGKKGRERKAQSLWTGAARQAISPFH